MPLYMVQATYSSESWAAQLKNPLNRLATVGGSMCEAAGGKLVGAWYCFGDYDYVAISDMPDAESAAAVTLALAAGGALKTIKTTVLMSGDQAVAAMKKATSITYKPPAR